MNNLNIHKRLKEARIYLKLNQLQIATELNIQQKTISEIENGKILNIPNAYVYFFYKKGISLNWIFDNKGLMIEKEYNKSIKEDKITNSMGKLFDFDDKNSNLSELPDKKTNKIVSNISDFDKLLNSKDFNIKSLFAYIKSQENMIEFLQRIIEKNLNL